MGYPVEDKRDWLTSQIRTILNRHGSDVQNIFSVSSVPQVKIENRVLPWQFQWFQNRSARKHVMGDPIWYVELIHSGPTTVLAESADGKPFAFKHTFTASMYLAYREAESDTNGVNGSTKLLDRILDSQESNVGLLVGLRRLGLQFAGANRDPLVVLVSDDYRELASMDKEISKSEPKCHVVDFMIEVCDEI